MMLFVFVLIGVAILGLTKRPGFGLAITPAPVPVSTASNARFYSQCGAGLQEQMDALFPERRAGELHIATKKSEGNRSRKPASAKVKKEWPVAIYFGIFGLGIMGYAIARVVLDGYPHPIHWAFGLAGAIIGYFGGWLWYRWRGDII